MRPAVGGNWRPSDLEDVDLKSVFERMAADLRGLAIYERFADGAVAFVDENATGNVEHLVLETPWGGKACICPPSKRAGCSALQFIAIRDAGYTPPPSKEA